MYAGELTEKLLIEAGTETRAAGGAVKMEWSNPAAIATRWAAAVPRTSKLYESLYGQHTEMTVAFKIRGRCAVRIGHRVQHAGRYLDVIGVLGQAGRPPEFSEEVTLVCKGRQ